MNQERKNRFYDVVSYLEDAVNEMQDIQDEEQEAYDNLSPGLQEGTRGDKMLEYIDLMDTGINQINQASKFIQESIIKKK